MPRLSTFCLCFSLIEGSCTGLDQGDPGSQTTTSDASESTTGGGDSAPQSDGRQVSAHARPPVAWGELTVPYVADPARRAGACRLCLGSATARPATTLGARIFTDPQARVDLGFAATPFELWGSGASIGDLGQDALTNAAPEGLDEPEGERRDIITSPTRYLLDILATR